MVPILFINICFSNDFKTAVSLMKEKKFDPGLNILIGLNKRNPDDIYILNNLGVVFLEKNQYNEARRMFRKALSIKEDFKSAFMNMGIVYYYQQDWYALIEHAIKGRERFVDETNKINLVLAYSYYRIRDFERSNEIFKSVVKQELTGNSKDLYEHLDRKLRIIGHLD